MLTLSIIIVVIKKRVNPFNDVFTLFEIRKANYYNCLKPFVESTVYDLKESTNCQN